MPDKLGQSVRSGACVAPPMELLTLPFVHSKHDASLSRSALLLLLLPEGSLCRFFFFLSPITFLDRMSAVKLPPMGIISCREPSWCVYKTHSGKVIWRGHYRTLWSAPLDSQLNCSRCLPVKEELLFLGLIVSSYYSFV